MLLENDLYEMISSVLDGKRCEIRYSHGVACCVVLVSKGYPGSYTKRLPIYWLDDIKNENVKIFHAGTKKEGDIIVSDGGRVLCVTAYSPKDIKDVRNMVYGAISQICMRGGFSYRKDIAKKIIC